MYTWSWNPIIRNADVFADGLLFTIILSALSVGLGTGLGFLLALLRRSSEPLLKKAIAVYIEVVRAIPILVLIIWFYYAVPVVVGYRLSAFWAAIIALSLSLSGFAAESIRAAVESIPASQYESGIMLGLSRWQIARHIVLPQAFRNMVPNLIGLYISTLKDSSLASIIAVGELLHQANILISQTFRPLEIYTTVALFYLMIVLPLTILASRLEKRLETRGSVA